MRGVPGPFTLGIIYMTTDAMGSTSEAALRDAILEVDGPDTDAVVVVGTNLPMARVAGMAEFWLGKPVIALNTATYWHALRANGITDQVAGFGRLLAEF